MNLLISVGLMLAVLGPLAASAWYVPGRLARLLGLERTRRLRAGWAVMLVVSLVCLVSFATSASPVLGAAYVVGGLVFMAHVYLCLALLALHGLSSRLRRERLEAWGAIVVAIGSTGLGSWSAGELSVAREQIAIPGLEHELLVAHVSDVHLGHHRGRDFLQRVVDQTNARGPDLVLVTGDLIDSNVALDPEVLAPLAAFEAPVYYVTGNHEYYIETDRALELIAAQGVHVMHNEVARTHGIQIVGLDYMNADDETFDMHPVGDRTIENELPKIPVSADAPLVLLHHSPVGLEYVAAAGTELMLAGHTHAGQVFPGTVLAPLVFQINQGLHVFEDMQIFVTPGAGTFGPRMRLGSDNVIHMLTLVPGGT